MGYDAFLSYSHAADGKLAANLQSGLHSLARPWYRLRALHVFRDKTSLSANPALWPAIEQALSQSEFFILMASLESAHSPWVQREVGWWLEHRSPETLLIVITEGEVSWNNSLFDFDWNNTTCLPANLRGKYSQEPLYVDLRWARAEEGLSLRQTQFRGAVLDIAAPLHHKPKDEIDGEDVRQHRRFKIASWTAGFLLFVLTIASITGAVKAVQNARVANANAETAKINQRKAEENQRKAEENQRKAEAATDEATKQQHLAEDRARIALSRQLAAEALNVMQSRQDLALLLGVEALESDDIFEARHSLLTALEWRPQLLAFLRGHTRRVESTEYDNSDRILQLAISADGSKMASTSWGRVVTLWDIKTRRPIGAPIEPLKNWGELTINPDLTTLAVNADSGILLWDIRSRKAVSLSSETLGDGGTLAFSPDGKLLATGSRDGILSLWDVATRERIGEPLTSSNAHGDPAKGELVSVSPFSFLAFTPDGSMVQAGSKFWNLKTRQPVNLKMEGTRTFAIADLRRETFAGITMAGDIILWNAKNGEEIATRHEKTGDCCFDRTLAISRDGRVIATGTQDGRIRLWDVSQLLLRATINAHSGAVNDLAFTRDGAALVSAGDDGTLALWDITMQHSPGRYIKLSRSTRIGAAAFSPDSRTLAASVDGSVRLWNPVTLRPVGQPLSSKEGAAMSLAFSPDGRVLAAGCSDDTVLLWDWRKGQTLGKPMQAFLRRGRSLSAVAFSPDGRLLASGSQDSSVLLWDLRTRRQTRFTESVDNIRPVHGLAFSADSKLLMAGGSSGGMLWDIPSRGPAHAVLEGQADPSRSIALSPDGKTLAGSAVRGVVLWDLATRRRIGTLVRPGLRQEDTINSMAFSPDGKLLAAATRDGDILLWDVEAREQIGRSLKATSLSGLWDEGSLTFSPDGRFLAVSNAENLGPGPEAGGIFLWEASPESWKTHACRMANRQLTQDEWQQFMGSIPYHSVCPRNLD
jgi:WD40 repeat protein